MAVQCAASSTDNAVVRFDGTSGCNIQNSPVIISDAGNVTGVTGLVVSPSTALGVAIEQPGNLWFNELPANGTGIVGFKGPSSVASSVVWELPASDGSHGEVLTTDGIGHLLWQPRVQYALSSTDNAIVRFDGTSGGNIQNSTVLVGDTGAITGAESLTVSPTTALGISVGQPGELRFLELPANGTEYVGFRAPSNIPTAAVWTLPNSDRGPGYQLTTDGAGVLSWAPPQGPGAFPTAILADTATITIAQINTRILTRSMSAPGTWTIDVASNIVAGFANPAINDYIDFTVINTDTGGVNDITLAVSPGNAVVGNVIVPSAAPTSRTVLDTGHFRIQLTNITPLSEAYVLYRLG